MNEGQLFGWLGQAPEAGQIAILALVGLTALIIGFALYKIGGNMSVGAANALTSLGKGVENVTEGIKQLAGPFNFWNKAGDAMIQEAKNREPLIHLAVQNMDQSMEFTVHGYEATSIVAEKLDSIPKLPAYPQVAQIEAPKKRGRRH